MEISSSAELKPNGATELGSYLRPSLKVLGLGGGGCNAINRMIELGIKDIEFIAANTDRQALNTNLADKKIQLGPVLTRGLGAGGNPEIGEAAAVESSGEIKEALEGADMVFLTAGLGGGTGTGAIPVAANIARQIGAVTVAIVTMPFSFEVGRRQKNAQWGLQQLASYTDTLIAISNDRLLQVRGGNVTLDVAFRVADDVLRQAVQGVTELVTEQGMINVDFSHIKRLMKMGGGSFLAIGQGEGEGKAMQAVHNALRHPLLETVSLDHASGILVNFSGGNDLGFHEVIEAVEYLQSHANGDTDIVMGVVNDDRMVNRAQAILIVTGIGARPIQEVLPGAERLKAAPAEQYSTAVINPAVSKTTSHSEVLPLANASQNATAGEVDMDVQKMQLFTLPQQPISTESNPLLTTENLDIPAFLRRRRLPIT